MKTENLVEQLREMVALSIKSNQYPPVHADAILGHLCVSKSDEQELFATIADRIEREYLPLPLDADGMPIRPGGNVFFVGGDEPHEVFGFDYDSGELEVHIGRRDGTSTDAYVKPGDLTHELDTLERIEKDAMKTFEEYWGCCNLECSECPSMIDGKRPWERYVTGIRCTAAQKLDLLRRQREVLERGKK